MLTVLRPPNYSNISEQEKIRVVKNKKRGNISAL